MSKIEFGKNCPLTQYLEEVSRLAGDGLKGPLAGALLYELGYPQFIQKLPDITITAQLVKQIVKASQTSLILESAEKCSNCPQSGSCKVGELIKVS
jgi:hypothetical protein